VRVQKARENGRFPANAELISENIVRGDSVMWDAMRRWEQLTWYCCCCWWLWW